MDIKKFAFISALLISTHCWAGDNPVSPEEPQLAQDNAKPSGLFKKPIYQHLRGPHGLRKLMAQLQGRPAPRRHSMQPSAPVPRFEPESSPAAGQIGYRSALNACRTVFFEPVEPPPQTGTLFYPSEHLFPPSPSVEGTIVTYANAGTRHVLILKSSDPSLIGKYDSWGTSKIGEPVHNTSSGTFGTFVQEMNRMMAIDPAIGEALREAKLEIPTLEDLNVPRLDRRYIWVGASDESEKRYEFIQRTITLDLSIKEPIHLETPGKIVFADGGFRHELILREQRNPHFGRGTYRAYALPKYGKEIHEALIDVTHGELFERFIWELKRAQTNDEKIKQAIHFSGIALEDLRGRR